MQSRDLCLELGSSHLIHKQKGTEGTCPVSTFNIFNILLVLTLCLFFCVSLMEPISTASKFEFVRSPSPSFPPPAPQPGPFVVELSVSVVCPQTAEGHRLAVLCHYPNERSNQPICGGPMTEEWRPHLGSVQMPRLTFTSGTGLALTRG